MFVLYLKRFRPKVKKEAYCENTKGPVSSHSLTHHHLSLIFRLGTVCLKGKTLSIHCDVCTVHERSFMFLSCHEVWLRLRKLFLLLVVCVWMYEWYLKFAQTWLNLINFHLYSHHLLRRRRRRGTVNTADQHDWIHSPLDPCPSCCLCC